MIDKSKSNIPGRIAAMLGPPFTPKSETTGAPPWRGRPSGTIGPKGMR